MKRNRSLIKQLNNYWLYIILIFAIAILLIDLLYLGRQQTNWEWNKELISALLGAAIVTAITSLLLNGQAKKDSEVDQKRKVFESRVNAYESFLEILRNVVVKSKVTQEDEKLLQFGVATIGMHADSQEMFRLSENLKRIIRKIKVDYPVDGSIWKEVIDIVRMFQFSLYEKQSMDNNSYMNKALRNFSGLCTEEHHEILEYVDCMLSDFHFDSFIADRCLYLSIPIQSRIWWALRLKNYKVRKIPKRLYVTLEIDNEVNGFYDGQVVIYCGKNSEDGEILTTIYNQYWQSPQKPRWKKSDFRKNKKIVEIGINYIECAYSFNIENMTKEEIRSLLVSTFIYINKVWAEKKNQFVTVMSMEKDKEGCEKKVKLDLGYEASDPSKFRKAE